ncbi:MAG: MarR family winged helix-turn-helix transcriptional regulator [Pseudomonadales bacterium]
MSRPDAPSPRDAGSAARPVGTRIMAGLTRALDWFDNSLQNVVASLGYEPFHRTQSMIIMHIALGIDTPSDIAREMSLTRQNVHHMAKVLIEKGVIESLPDPRDPRRSVYRLSEQASELRTSALAAMTELENVLEQRIGATRVKALREALSAEWGPEVRDASELGKTTPSGSLKRPR